MFSNVQSYSTLAKRGRMSLTRKTVSTERMEEEWLEIQAAQESPARFRPLYNRYYEPIFRFIFRRTASEELTADLCSQVFLKALQNLKDYTYQGVPFSAWLYRIASNEVSQYYRQHARNRVVSIDEVNLNEMMDEMDSPAYREGLREALIDALDELTEKDMQLIELRFFEQRPFKEIAEILDMTESNAKVRTYRILERMKKRIDR